MMVMGEEDRLLATNHQRTTPPSSTDPNRTNDNQDKDDAPQQQKQKQQQQKEVHFFLFICISTAVRSFEAGIVASMMSDIQLELNLEYGTEGTIVASTDYGIALGSIMAIFVFRPRRQCCCYYRCSARWILGIVMIGTAVCAFGCVWRPTKTNLLLARSMGGMLWAQAATHYPVWINDRGKRSNGASRSSRSSSTNNGTSHSTSGDNQKDQSNNDENTNDTEFTAQRKTIWLATTNVCLLGGVISGYIVGGAVRAATDSVQSVQEYGRVRQAILMLVANCTWVDLYFLEGLLMLVCGAVVILGFEDDLLTIGQTTEETTNRKRSSRNSSDVNITNNDDQQQRQQQPFQKNEYSQAYDSIERTKADHTTTTTFFGNDNSSKPANDDHEDDDLKEVILELARSPPFVFAVAISGCISGGIVFALYFVTQVCEARGMEVGTTLLFVTLVFVTAPAPGIVFGSWIVSTFGGGYTDHVVTFAVALGSAVCVLLAAIALPVSWAIWGTWKVPFVTAFWIFAFAGAMSGPPLNGVAVSAVPHASHVASALQFSLSNAAKIVVPQLGGYVCTLVGLIDGFHATLVATSLVFVGLSWLSLVYAKDHRATNAVVPASPPI